MEGRERNAWKEEGEKEDGPYRCSCRRWLSASICRMNKNRLIMSCFVLKARKKRGKVSSEDLYTHNEH
jgi:hypothetical protein